MFKNFFLLIFFFFYHKIYFQSLLKFEGLSKFSINDIQSITSVDIYSEKI